MCYVLIGGQWGRDGGGQRLRSRRTFGECVPCVLHRGHSVWPKRSLAASARSAKRSRAKMARVPARDPARQCEIWRKLYIRIHTHVPVCDMRSCGSLACCLARMHDSVCLLARAFVHVCVYVCVSVCVYECPGVNRMACRAARVQVWLSLCQCVYECMIFLALSASLRGLRAKVNTC